MIRDITERLGAAIDGVFAVMRFSTISSVIAEKATRAASEATTRSVGVLPEGAAVRWRAVVYDDQLVICVADSRSAELLRSAGVKLVGVRFIEGGRVGDLLVVQEMRQNELAADGWFLLDEPPQRG